MHVQYILGYIGTQDMLTTGIRRTRERRKKNSAKYLAGGTLGTHDYAGHPPTMFILLDYFPRALQSGLTHQTSSLKKVTLNVYVGWLLASC